MTRLPHDRLLVYGGQTMKAGRAQTLRDVYLYDIVDKSWTRPVNCEGLDRQWHSATYLPSQQLLLCFGGEALTKSGKTKMTDQVMVLDTDIMLWYPPSVSGDIPSGRSGHSATHLPATNELVVFGGVCDSKWLRSVSVLNTQTWQWRTIKAQGNAPKPRSYHSATAIDGRIVVFGGNNADMCFQTVHVLDTNDWTWSAPEVMGAPPTARTGHSAVLLEDNKTLCVYGGWDPNDGTKDDTTMLFNDSYYLNTETWTWSKGPVMVCADSPTRRVGHTTVALSQDKLLMFGGRTPNDQFTGDMISTDI
jgi:N-acetylneuraminic acid mutarotase